MSEGRVTRTAAEIAAVSVLAGGAVGAIATLVPAQFRPLGLFGLLCGFGLGAVLGRAFSTINTSDRRVRVGCGIAAAVVTLVVYVGLSVRAYADEIAPRTPEEMLAASVMADAPDDILGERSRSTLSRWTTWRSSAVTKSSSIAVGLGVTEAIVCVVATAVTAGLRDRRTGA